MLTTFEQFCSWAENYNVVPVVKSFTADKITPVSAFEALVGSGTGYLLESVDQAGRFSRYSFVGRKPIMRIIKSAGKSLLSCSWAKQTDNLDSFLNGLDYICKTYKAPGDLAYAPFSSGLVGYIGYDIIREIEKIPANALDDLAVPDALMELPSELAIFDHFKDVIYLVAIVVLDKKIADHAKEYKKALDSLDSMVSDLEKLNSFSLDFPTEFGNNDVGFSPNMKREKFQEIVKIGKKYIFEGDVFQVVLSQRFDFPLEVEPFDIYRALRLINPSPYLFYLSFPEVIIVGSSPEPMVKVEKDRVISRPIAGTRPRGKDDIEDRELANDLLSDPKEKAEHVMLVDLARNDVGKVCQFGTVKVDEFMTVEYYSHVIHLTSQVTGTLQSDKTVVDVLKACLPAGTVSGAPKVRAMQIIDELEPTKRGIYAGVIGYLDLAGNLDTAIAIRTLVVTPDKICHLQAGCGVVADSDPSREFEETLHKAKAVLTAVSLAKSWHNARIKTTS